MKVLPIVFFYNQKTKSMKLSKALKLKNKLVAEINAAMVYVAQHNSCEEGTPRVYPVREKLAEAMEKTNQLVELKAKIHKANLPVWDKVFRLSELKSMVSKVKHLNTEQKAASPSGYRDAVTAEITLSEKDSMVKELEEAIEAIQEELDQHNHTTEV
jgi:hypothetical protein